jgi:hypothetical protein
MYAQQSLLNAQRAELALAAQPEDQLLMLCGDFAVGGAVRSSAV